MVPKIHPACNGHAIWPTAERVRRTSVPKSITGSKVFKPITSFGCKCLITDDPSGNCALRVRHPWSPLLAKRSCENPDFLHPHGHALVWDPQACKAHGAFPFPLSMYLMCFSSLTPKASSSISSSASWCSSLEAHSLISGITCCTSCMFCKIGHAFQLHRTYVWRRQDPPWSVSTARPNMVKLEFRLRAMETSAFHEMG